MSIQTKKELSRRLSLGGSSRNVIIAMVTVIVAFATLSPAYGQQQEPPKVMGMSLTELGDYLYDAAPAGAPKTDAQKMVDRLAAIGIKQINLSPRGFMTDPRGTEIVAATQGARRSEERQRYMRLIRYIHDKGIAVGIRPMLFVVDGEGNTPLVEVLPDGTKKDWWHGNIQPKDPNAWFESFKTFLDIYLPVARAGKVEEFTIGAELYSMTVGIEDQWIEHPHGFPGRWLELLKHVRSRVTPNTRIMYDINFTDDKVEGDSIDEFGGEMVRWRYRLVDLAEPDNEEEAQIWRDLVEFWNSLDAIGIDMYRSLASAETELSSNPEILTTILEQTAQRYASQIDNILFDIESITGAPKPVYLKEVGYRSVENGFINPFTYAGSGAVNVPHQLAAYQAMFNAFWNSGWTWLKGIILWDASIDPAKHGVFDNGFSPMGKPEVENCIEETVANRPQSSATETLTYNASGASK